ncbi:MAG TPA: hypothetical protein VMV69_30075 [Pirellulales bacterium]|nr:hypothetical protein [Pirellulales bacterium]
MADHGLNDDPSIADSEALWRRIPPTHCVLDRNLGRVRPSSAAFENHPNGSPMSVVLGKEVIAAGRDAESVLKGHEGYALASFSAGLARQCGQAVARDPLDEEPAHALVIGKKTGSVKRAVLG